MTNRGPPDLDSLRIQYLQQYDSQNKPPGIDPTTWENICKFRRPRLSDDAKKQIAVQTFLQICPDGIFPPQREIYQNKKGQTKHDLFHKNPFLQTDEKLEQRIRGSTAQKNDADDTWTSFIMDTLPPEMLKDPIFQHLLNPRFEPLDRVTERLKKDEGRNNSSKQNTKPLSDDIESNMHTSPTFRDKVHQTLKSSLQGNKGVEKTGPGSKLNKQNGEMQAESRKRSQSVDISDRLQNRNVIVHSEKEYFFEGLDLAEMMDEQEGFEDEEDIEEELEITTDKKLLSVDIDELLRWTPELFKGMLNIQQLKDALKPAFKEEENFEEEFEHKEEQDFKKKAVKEEHNEEKECYPLNMYYDMIPYLRGTDILYFRNKYPKDKWTEKATNPKLYGECRFTLHFGELDQNEYSVVMDRITIHECLSREMDDQSEWFLAFCDRLWIEAADQIDHEFVENYGYTGDPRYDDARTELLYQQLQQKKYEKKKIHEKRNKETAEGEKNSKNEDIFSGKEYLNLQSLWNMPWRRPNLQEEAHKKVYTLMKEAEDEMNNQMRHILEVPPLQESLEGFIRKPQIAEEEEKCPLVIASRKKDQAKTLCFQPTLREAPSKEKEKAMKKTGKLTMHAEEEEEKKQLSHISVSSEKNPEDLKSHLQSVTNSKDGHIKTSCFKPNQDMSSLPYFQTCHFESNPIQEANDPKYQKDFDRELRTRFEDTSSFPYSVHGIVRGSFGNGEYETGTGILIGPDLVLTAAHVIYDCKETKKKYPIIEFIPGINEDAMPFGSYNVVESYVPDEFLKTLKQEDYALLFLDGRPGSFAGYFGLHVAEKELLKGKELNVIGYPGSVRDEKKKLKELSRNGLHQLWGMKGNSYFNNGENGEFSINYRDILTTGGQSGSGVFYEIEGVNEYYVVGVHVCGRGRGGYNSATWITMKRFDQITRWVVQSRRTLISPKIVHEGQDSIAIIKELKLYRSSVGDIEAAILSEYVTPHLKSLDLRDNLISAKGATALSKNTWTDLTTLDLTENNIGDKGATGLSMNNSWRNLTTLGLRKNNIGAEGATSLSKNNTWKNLTALDLSGNNIGTEGATALSKNTSWTNLTELYLSLNNIGDCGATGLSTNNSWPKLTTLDLLWNEIGADGTTALSKNNSWKNLKILDLSFNDIGPKGATALSKNTSWTNLTNLYLSNCKIGNEGETGLSTNTSWKNLTSLDSSEDCKVGEGGEGRSAILKKWPTIDLRPNPFFPLAEWRFNRSIRMI